MRIDAALEAIGRVGGETEALAGPADGLRAKICGLEHDVGRGGVDLGVLSAHDAGDDERLGFVGDDEHAAVELALLAVECGELLVVGGATNDDAVSANLARVEHVQRLTQLEHDEVADVDEIVDRAEADGSEALL